MQLALSSEMFTFRLHSMSLCIFILMSLFQLILQLARPWEVLKYLIFTFRLHSLSRGAFYFSIVSANFATGPAVGDIEISIYVSATFIVSLHSIFTSIFQLILQLAWPWEVLKYLIFTFRLHSLSQHFYFYIIVSANFATGLAVGCVEISYIHVTATFTVSAFYFYIIVFS